MILKTANITLDSNGSFQIIDITAKINHEIAEFGIYDGLINIFSKHSTSAIVVNENEYGLLKDMEFCLSNLINENYSYNHDRIDNNASAHLKSFLLSSSESIPIKNGKLDLGTWQSVFFIELDGPRQGRNVELTALGR